MKNKDYKEVIRDDAMENINYLKTIFDMCGIECITKITKAKDIDNELFVGEIYGKDNKDFSIQLEASYDYFESKDQNEDTFKGFNMYIALLDENGEETINEGTDFWTVGNTFIHLKSNKINEIHTKIINILWFIYEGFPIRNGDGQFEFLIISGHIDKGYIKNNRSRISHRLYDLEFLKENKLLLQMLERGIGFDDDGGKNYIMSEDLDEEKLALTVDGNITYCVASEESIGKGRCVHVAHQNAEESLEDLPKRVKDMKVLNDEGTIR